MSLISCIIDFCKEHTFFPFSYDYLKITNEHSQSFGVYCGRKTGIAILVSGNYAMLIFHTDGYFEERGFLLYFTAIILGKYNEIMSFSADIFRVI